MPDEAEMQQLGAFEPREAKRLLPLLEQHGIRFEIEADYSELARPNRFLGLEFGMYPDGARIVIFVPENEISRALEVSKQLFPD